MEINREELLSDFSETTLIFEQVWYGKENVSRANVDKMAVLSNHLKGMLS